MKNISVSHLNGSDSEAQLNDAGYGEMLCPCGTMLPIAPGKFGLTVPLLCTCGRKFDVESVDAEGLPNRILEHGGL